MHCIAPTQSRASRPPCTSRPSYPRTAALLSASCACRLRLCPASLAVHRTCARSVPCTSLCIWTWRFASSHMHTAALLYPRIAALIPHVVPLRLCPAQMQFALAHASVPCTSHCGSPIPRVMPCTIFCTSRLSYPRTTALLSAKVIYTFSARVHTRLRRCSAPVAAWTCARVGALHHPLRPSYSAHGALHYSCTSRPSMHLAALLSTHRGAPIHMWCLPPAFVCARHLLQSVALAHASVPCTSLCIWTWRFASPNHIHAAALLFRALRRLSRMWCLAPPLHLAALLFRAPRRPRVVLYTPAPVPCT